MDSHEVAARTGDVHGDLLLIESKREARENSAFYSPSVGSVPERCPGSLSSRPATSSVAMNGLPRSADGAVHSRLSVDESFRPVRTRLGAYRALVTVCMLDSS